MERICLIVLLMPFSFVFSNLVYIRGNVSKIEGMPGSPPRGFGTGMAVWDTWDWVPVMKGYRNDVDDFYSYPMVSYLGNIYSVISKSRLFQVRYDMKDDGFSANFSGQINALSVGNNKLYVAGAFDAIQGKKFRYIAAFDGTIFNSVEGTDQLGEDSDIQAISWTPDNSIMFLCGNLRISGQKAALAAWLTSDARWVVLLEPSRNRPLTGTRVLPLTRNLVVLGGDFELEHSTSKDPVVDLVVVDYSDTESVTVTPLNTADSRGKTYNSSCRVRDLYPGAYGEFFVVGSFAAIDGQAASNIAQVVIDGSSDSGFVVFPLQNGTDNEASSLAVAQNPWRLYVGGKFRRAGNLIANRIAMWNGSNWNQLTLGFSDEYDAAAGLKDIWSIFATQESSSQIVAPTLLSFILLLVIWIS